jgi:hypothetical protein
MACFFPSQNWSPVCLAASKREYRRAQQLPALLKLWPHDLDDYPYPGTLKLVAMLRRALRAERIRARAGHWAYDLNRHLALIEALKAERSRLRALAPAVPARVAATRLRRAGTLSLPASRQFGAISPAVSAGWRPDPSHKPR